MMALMGIRILAVSTSIAATHTEELQTLTRMLPTVQIMVVASSRGVFLVEQANGREVPIPFEYYMGRYNRTASIRDKSSFSSYSFWLSSFSDSLTTGYSPRHALSFLEWLRSSGRIYP